jgi:AcrR family transcriptional regulator
MPAPRKRVAGDLREILLRAAIKLVNERGVEALTIRETARLAGVSHQAPYSHFADKAALLAAVAEQGFRELYDRMARAAERAGDDPDARLRAIGVEYVEFAVENPAQFRVMYSSEVADRDAFPSLLAQCDAIHNLLITTIVDLQRRTGDHALDPSEYALAAWSVVHGLASLVINNQVRKAPLAKREPRELMEIVSRVLRNGLPRGR